jgi:hypothetical protein
MLAIYVLRTLLSISEFGDPGTWMPSGAVGFTLNQTYPPFGQGSRSYSVSLAPGLAYFVAKDLELGAIISGGFASAIDLSIGGRINIYSVGLVPHVGYALHLNPVVTFLPRLGLGYTYNRIAPSDFVTTASGNTAVTQHTLTVVGTGWFLFHITDRAFVAAGPEITYDALAKLSHGVEHLSDNTQNLTFKVQGMLGFWL